MHETVDRRLREVVHRALDGCAYESSHFGERVFDLEARRPDGRKVRLRFLGVHYANAESAPPAGAHLALERVSSTRKLKLLDFVFFWRVLFRPPYSAPDLHARRVTISAGEAKIEVVCEDAEWFEETAPGR